MTKVLFIAEPVLTGDLLRRLHQGQQQLCCEPGAVITPTGWDYIRQYRLQVSRGSAPAPTSGPGIALPLPNPGSSLDNDQELIKEVPPQMVSLGRCDQPDQPYGCRNDEFGSGFASPPPKERPASPGARQDPEDASGQLDIETLIQQITDLVIDELARK